MNLLISHKVCKYATHNYMCIRSISLFIVILWFALPMNAITYKEANECYKKGDYNQAIIDYNKLLKHRTSAELYYNLGNAFYRVDNLPQAILAYKRALKLAPENEDIRFNLNLASSKTTDKIVPQDDIFYLVWYRNVLNLFDTNNWAYISLFSIALALSSILVYIFSPNIFFHKLGFFFSIPLFGLFILSFIFAYKQKSIFEDNSNAVIMKSSVNIKETPTYDGKNNFVLHEGTCVNITDEEVRGWVCVRVADGRSGWISKNSIERV